MTSRHVTFILFAMKKFINSALKEFRGQSILKKTADIAAVIIIAAGIAVSIYMNNVGRSLWLDEAMLAYSFSTRDILNLTRGVFEWDQSAPVLFLYIAKILTLIFGNTETVLRAVSVISYVLMLGLVIYISKYVFRSSFSLQCAAFLANMNFLLEYSNMFKQYMSECVWVLLVLVVYKLYRDGRFKWFDMTGCFMLFIWGANPSCFFMGGILVYEFFEGLIKKNREQIFNTVRSGIGVGISFIAYYFVWLREVAESSSMQSYWQNADFPLIPRSLEDINLAKAMIYEIFVTFREARLFMAALVAAAFIIGIIWEKDRYVSVTLLGFFVTLFASFIHMFPVADRLWCFSFPLFAILGFMAIDRMSSGSRRAQAGAIALCAALILSNNGIGVYRRGENVFRAGEEANAPIARVYEDIKEGEYAYVYYQTIPVVKYRIGYDTDTIGGLSAPNVIWGSGFLNTDKAGDDLKTVTSKDSCYIIYSHGPMERVSPLLDECRDKGYLFVVMDENETPLYHYAKDKEHVKASVSYELTDREDEDDTCYATIRVTNTGSCIINSQGEGVRIASRDREDAGTNLWGNLKPGEYFDMPLQFDWNGDTSVSLQLRQGDEGFWYDEIGCKPLTIEK